jgi:DNA-directed RNA polymerase subunit N (RpoN/RPB10)
MKVIIILATGTLLTFPTIENIKPDCFSQGYNITQKISTYHGPEEKGEDQGWVLNDSNIEVAGWYCR